MKEVPQTLKSKIFYFFNNFLIFRNYKKNVCAHYAYNSSQVKKK